MSNCNKCDTVQIQPKCKKVDGLTIVVIPAQLGSSEEGELYAPATCKYKNTLVKYLADGMVYLYDKDGNWTLVADSDVKDLTIDDELDIHSEHPISNKAVTTAVNDLTAQIENEASIREANDTALQTNIDNETTARTNADTTLQSNIDTEKTRAEQAESDLDSKIDQEIQDRKDDVDAEETRAKAAEATLQENIENEASIRASEDVSIRADIATEVAKETEDIKKVQEELNRDFVNDLEMSSDAQSVTFTEDKVNPVTGAVSKEYDIIPTASATTAGTMSAAEFNSITDSQQKLEALLGGAVVIYNLPEDPSQEQLTTAWENETQRDELINRASIYDATNSIVWTYYTNASVWEPVQASGGGVTVKQWTNTTAGTVLGSTLDGNITANSDGTGSVNGWSDLKNTVAAKANSNDLATVATSGSYNDLSSKPTIPTVNNATLTIQKNGTNVATFTANSATNTTANLTMPTSFSDLSGTVGTSQIANSAVTNAKIGSAAVKSNNIDWTTLGTNYISSTTFTNCTNSSSYIIKFPNNLVIFYFHLNTTAQMQTGGTQLGTIPSAVRPSADYMFFTGSIPWASAVMNFAIRSNGQIVGYPLANRASGARVDVSGHYFSAS